MSFPFSVHRPLAPNGGWNRWPVRLPYCATTPQREFPILVRNGDGTGYAYVNQAGVTLHNCNPSTLVPTLQDTKCCSKRVGFQCTMYCSSSSATDGITGVVIISYIWLQWILKSFQCSAYSASYGKQSTTLCIPRRLEIKLSDIFLNKRNSTIRPRPHIDHLV